MPGEQKPPADGQPGTGDPTGGAPAGGTPPKPDATPPKTFTQAELDDIVRDRLKRAVPADYEEFKAKAAKADAADEEKKTELQKAQDRATAAEKDRDGALQTANARLRQAAILTEANAQGAVDAATVAALLAGSADVKVGKDGDVEGAKDAVKSLLKERPFLVKAALPPKNGGEFGGTDPKDAPARIAELERAGLASTDPKVRREKFAEARELKMRSSLERA